MTSKQLSHNGELACERPDVSSSTTWKTVLRQLLLLNGITPSCHTCMSPPLSKRQVEQGCDAIQQRRIEAVIAGAAGSELIVRLCTFSMSALHVQSKKM